MELFSDAAHFASFGINGAINGALGFVNNALSIAQDLYNMTAGLCLGKASGWALSQSANLALQGLHLPALNLQIDGFLKNFALAPFHLDGVLRMPHLWRFECRALKEGLRKVFTSAGEVKSRLDDFRRGSASGAMPGSLLYASYGEDPLPPGEDYLWELPMRAAARMGSPYAVTIRDYIINPDPSRDSMTATLPALIYAAEPRIGRLVQILLAFQKIMERCHALTLSEMVDLKRRASQVVEQARLNYTKVGGVERLVSNVVNNRQTYAQQKVLVDLLQLWDLLVVDLISVVDADLRQLVTDVLEPRSRVLALGESSATILGDAPDYLDVFGEHTGPEVAYALSAYAGLVRVQTILGDPTIDQGVALKRAAPILATSYEHMKEVTFGGPHTAYVGALAEGAAAGNPEAMYMGAMGPAMQAVQKLVDHQHKSLSASTEMMAQQRGVRSFEIRESSNEIDPFKENNDTQSYLAGALDRQSEALKTIVTKALPSVSGIASAIKNEGVSEMVAGREAVVDATVKEMANALTSTTINKTTGTRLNQQYEGSVNHAKFMLNQAGTSIAHEAPVIRSTARLKVLQAKTMLTEADVHDTRARWKYQVVEDSYGVATTDWHIMAKGRAVLSANEAYYFGQQGTTMADKKKVLFAIPKGQLGPIPIPGTKAMARMTDAGVIEITADTKIVLMVGTKSLTITNDRIDMNPLIPPIITPETVQVKFVAHAGLARVTDKAAGKLPSKGSRNPVPCAAPTKDPTDPLSALLN
jgi:hypothetical protein